MSQVDSFFCLDLTGNNLPHDAQAVKNSREFKFELTSALNRHTGNLPLEDYDDAILDKLGEAEVAFEMKSGPPSGWSYSTEKGFASYIKPGPNPRHTERAARCHHGNVAKQMGSFRLYQALLNEVDKERPETAPASVLQSALNSYDFQAIAFSRWWARWGTRVLKLDEPVRGVEEAYGLERRYAHDRNAKSLRIGSVESESRTRVFISYSHADAEYFNRLKTHLNPLKDLEKWAFFADDLIKLGEVWPERISTAIEQADIAILLLSPDFFASEFIKKQELPLLLEKHSEGRMTILPLVVNTFFPFKGSPAEKLAKSKDQTVSLNRCRSWARLATRFTHCWHIGWRNFWGLVTPEIQEKREDTSSIKFH